MHLDPSAPTGDPAAPTPAPRQEWEESVRTQTHAAFLSLRRNATLNFLVRLGLNLSSLASIAVFLWYATRRGDDMVRALLDQEESNFHEETLLALTIPLILMMLLAAISLGAALVVQSRGRDEFESGLAGISRLRREAIAGVARTRETTHVLEEFVVNARRAFRLQLWFARTLFLVSLTLFAAAVVDAIISSVDVGTIALAAGSLTGLLIGIATGAGSSVGMHLGDATQMQLVVANATRQVSVVEEHLLKTVEVHERTPEAARAAIEQGLAQITAITERSVDMIQLYAEPANDPKEQNRQIRARARSLRGAPARAHNGVKPAPTA